MAFNFNWSPLIADTSRARDMLTTALNKSPKPPIIVDDIIVTELNLGSTPPELEILEIGDLAEDRFRGIFKMSYTGDAFLTLKTKVQANPLNTYLSTKPSFASPEPLAAAAGLTIPLQITLSDIRLSGFVILVFSKQKGLTLVFRNDPLESLKVSSTFDSIPFVRDYLQKEIEGQLRVLFMEDLPAIIHRLSLRLWSPEFQELEERLDAPHDTTTPVDALATNPPDAVDAFGNPIDDQTSNATLTLDTASEIHASFSKKNILRLAALSESQRTLSLFTPGIFEAVFRAWAAHPEPTSGAVTPALTLSSLARMQSGFASIKSQASSVASGSTGQDSHSSRPTLASANSVSAGLSLGAGRFRTHPIRKRKKRVVDLRKQKDGTEDSDASTTTTTPTVSTAPSENANVIMEEPLATPKASTDTLWSQEQSEKISEPAAPTGLLPAAPLSEPTRAPLLEKRSSSSRPPLSHARIRSTQQASSPLFRSLSFDKINQMSSSAKGTISPPCDASIASSSGGILEQAWMLKMAQEIARKVQEEKSRGFHPGTGGLWATSSSEDELDAPPAYHA
ncbi:hypothetical protein M011DRAFT_401557 [Sporormia fimetaria CBS 119925]|uniref:Mitochondrial distribution and morphology protein 34 n=1 Tax=Sporormia fimetaria CBS 119925 TaxID=1340428 RepID=A0A6A6VC94_9PLEO|nr:hypothetical protein M011DRAFT_401557 [Sporormia fimetaria CBS 119925]